MVFLSQSSFSPEISTVSEGDIPALVRRASIRINTVYTWKYGRKFYVRTLPLDYSPVFRGPVPYPWTTAQCSVVQYLTPGLQPSVPWSNALYLDHDPVLCGPVPYP